MRRIVILLLAAVGSFTWGCGSDAPPAPAGVSTRQVVVAIDGRSFPALLVRPTAPGPHPVVAFAHGYLQGPSRYRPLLETIAAHGYIAIAPDTQTSPMPQPAELADDLWRAIRWVRAHEPGAHARLAAVAGHSMGGGAAVQAAADHPPITAAITLAAVARLGSWRIDARPLTRPAAYLVGTSDRIVPPAETRRLFDQQRGPADWFVIRGGSHCGFVGTIGLAGIPCDFGGIPAEEQERITDRIVVAWLDRTLKNGPPVAVPGEVTAEHHAGR